MHASLLHICSQNNSLFFRCFAWTFTFHTQKKKKKITNFVMHICRIYIKPVFRARKKNFVIIWEEIEVKLKCIALVPSVCVACTSKCHKINAKIIINIPFCPKNWRNLIIWLRFITAKVKQDDHFFPLNVRHPARQLIIIIIINKIMPCLLSRCLSLLVT